MCHKLKAVFLFNGLGVVAKSNLNAALSYKRTAKNLGNTVSCCSLNLCFYDTHSSKRLCGVGMHVVMKRKQSMEKTRLFKSFAHL